MVETGWVQPTTTPCLPAALRALQNTENHCGTTEGRQDPGPWEKPPGTPAEDNQPFPSPMGLLLLGQENSIAFPRRLTISVLVQFFSLSVGVGLRDTHSWPPFSCLSFVSFFGAVLYLFLFQPWGFPLLMTGKGATSWDLLFHHQPEQERVTCAQGPCKRLPRMGAPCVRSGILQNGRLDSTVVAELGREREPILQEQDCGQTCILSP